MNLSFYESVHLRLVARLGQRAPDAVHVGGLLVAHLEQRAARELDREIEPARGKEEHRHRERDHRDDVEHERVPHERDRAADLEELHRSAHFHAVLPMCSRSILRRCPCSALTMARETTTEE